MARQKIRVGLIGASTHYGWSMKAHLPALLALRQYELTAVCTAHKETAEESARHYGARLAFHDYKEMVKHPDIDLISVSVSVHSHHPLVMAALEAGKHVICEWPLGVNSVEAEEMASVARASGVRHMIDFQARGNPALLRLKELIEEGYVGEVLTCNMTAFMPGLLQRGLDRPWMADREKGATTLTLATGHCIDAFCFGVGEFRELSARVSTQVPAWETSEPGKTVDVTAPDNVMVNGVLGNGAVASVHIATVPWHGTGSRIEVYGMEGTLVASTSEMVQRVRVGLKGGQGKDGALEELPIPDRLTWVPDEVPRGDPFNVAQMYHHLGEAIQNEAPAEPDFDHALMRHRLLDTIQRSSDQGVVVSGDIA